MPLLNWRSAMTNQVPWQKKKTAWVQSSWISLRQFQVWSINISGILMHNLLIKLSQIFTTLASATTTSRLRLLLKTLPSQHRPNTGILRLPSTSQNPKKTPKLSQQPRKPRLHLILNVSSAWKMKVTKVGLTTQPALTIALSA